MNWLNIISDIHRILDANGLHDVSQEIIEDQLAGLMPGEMFTLVVTKLISIREDRPEVYALIKEETEWLIAYARVLGHNR